MPGQPISDPPEVSVVMPCLNEAETLAVCIQKARACLADNGVAGEIIVADVNQPRIDELVAPDREALNRLIRKED